MLLKQQTDDDIMVNVANGNLDLLKILFDKHHLHVFNFLYKMSGDKMLSEDLTQEVFYKVIKYRKTYKKGKFIAWLFTIARNSFKSHLRKNKILTSDLDPLVNQLENGDKVKEEDYSDLQRALNKLEASDREILLLNRLQEIRYQELAEILDSTPGAVKTKVSRALKKLKKIYLESI